MMSSSRGAVNGRHSASAKDLPSAPTTGSAVRSLLAQLTPSSHRHRPPAANRQLRPIMIFCAVLVLAFVVTYFVAESNRHSSQPSTKSAAGGTHTNAVSASASSVTDLPTPPVAQLISWARTNLPTAAVIVSDTGNVSALRDAGFTSATTFQDTTSAALRALDYVLWTSGSETSEQSSKLLNSSLPLAVVADGAQEASLRQIYPDGAKAAASDQTRDLSLRKAGGAQLATNPALIIDAATRASLRQGKLDLRAQNVVNLLAANGRIGLSIGSEQAIETRAGLPPRVVTITASEPAAMKVTLAALAPPYRPSSIMSIAPNKVRLSWLPEVAPVAAVGG
jgi:hypothetical protein